MAVEPTAPELEITDVDVPQTKALKGDIVTAILNGRLGIFAQVKSKETPEWKSLYQVPPFAYLMPILVPSKKQFGNLSGLTYICSDAQKIADKGYELRAKNQFKEGGFFMPVWTGKNYDIMIPTKMFDFSRGVYAIPLFLPNVVEPLGKMTLYLIILNLSKQESKVKVSLQGKGFIVPDQSKEQLGFSLDAGKTLHNHIPLTITEKKHGKEHSMQVLGEASTGSRVASSVATAALSLGLSLALGGGMFVSSYNRGKGFNAKWSTTDEKPKALPSSP